MADGWQPAQYERFAEQRSQPFHDLLALVEPVPGGTVLDLGCGSGALTVELHRRTGAATTLGVDSSHAMLLAARDHEGGGVSFRWGDIADVDAVGADAVFSNAALQWVPGHAEVIERIAGEMPSGAQLAFQVPANADHASHTTIAEAAAELADRMTEPPPADVVRDVLAPEGYAELLDRLGFVEQHVRLQVYGHRLASTAEVVEWTKGTSLVRFRRIMAPQDFEHLVDRYRARLLEVLGDRRPYFYTFKRILVWARR